MIARAGRQGQNPSTGQEPAAGQPALTEQPLELGSVETPGVCWCCGGRTVDRHCKIVCSNCGFMRDCSDP